MVVDGDPPAPIEERYEARSTCWSRCTANALPDTLPVAPGVHTALPRYDMDAMLIEVELLLDWYLPRLGATVPDDDVRDDYVALWREALLPALDGAADLGAARLSIRPT